MKIWYNISDCGDGSMCTRFFDSASAEYYSRARDVYYSGYAVDGYPSSFTADNVSGLRIYTLDDYRKMDGEHFSTIVQLEM